MTRLWAALGSLAQYGRAGRSLFRYIWRIWSARRGVSACHWTMFWLPPMLVTDARASKSEYGSFVASEAPLDSAFRASAVYCVAPACLGHAPQPTPCGLAAS